MLLLSAAPFPNRTPVTKVLRSNQIGRNVRFCCGTMAAGLSTVNVITTLPEETLSTPHTLAKNTITPVSRALFGTVIFLGAFLLFSVQLLLGKYILPWFGGTAGVWATCLFFFQTTLLAGYAYAHGSVSRFALPVQARLHAVLILASLLLM